MHSEEKASSNTIEPIRSPVRIGLLSIAICFGLGHFDKHLALVSAVLSFNSGYRSLLATEPRLAFLLARLPRSSLSGAFWLSMIHAGAFLLAGDACRLALRVWPPRSGLDQPLLDLYQSALGWWIGLAGIVALALPAIRKLRRELVSCSSRATTRQPTDGHAQRLEIEELTPQQRRRILRALLGKPSLEQTLLGSVKYAAATMPLYGRFLSVFLVAAGLLGLCCFGFVLSLLLAALASRRSWRIWLIKQPGYRHRLRRLHGWNDPSPARLALAAFLYGWPISALFWGVQWAAADFAPFPLGWELALTGALGAGLVWGWTFRNWPLLSLGPVRMLRTATRPSRQAAIVEKLHEHCSRGDLLMARIGSLAWAARSRSCSGPGDLHTAAAMGWLGSIEMSLGNWAAAEAPLSESLRIRRTRHGPIHLEIADSLHRLALLRQRRGDGVTALPLFQEAIVIWHASGRFNADYAALLRDAGSLYRQLGIEETAVLLLHSASDLLHQCEDKTLGATARAYADASGFARGPAGNEGEATPRTGSAGRMPPKDSAAPQRSACSAEEESGAQLRAWTESVAPILACCTPRQRTELICSRYQQISSFLGAALSRDRHSRIACSQGFDAVVSHKSSASASIEKLLRKARRSRRADVRGKLAAATKLKRRISDRVLSGPGLEGQAAQGQVLREWRAAEDRLDLELFRATRRPRPDFDRVEAIRRSVADAIPQGSAIVEFVVSSDEPERTKRGRRLFAFVLHSRDSKSIRWVDLGRAQPILKLLSLFLDAVLGLRTDLRAGSPGPSHRTGLRVVEQRHLGWQLRRVLFDPLAEALKGARRILICPDGPLNRLPFEILPVGRYGHLIDRVHFSYLRCSGEALHFRSGFAQPLAPALVVADPKFDLAESTRRRLRLGRKEKGPATVRPRFRFEALPGSAQEGRIVGSLVGGELCVGPMALKEPILRRRSPWIVHFATHGFIPDGGASDGWSFGSERLDGLARVEDAMFHSGLALAGANTWLHGGELPRGAGDGLLTAADAALLDLSDTELAVLSACQTGLGPIQPGEGVIGLGRAFRIAGARTLLISLWPVCDRIAVRIMQTFYLRLTAGRSRSGALRDAMRIIKRDHPNPRHWGAFICQGDPGPLSRLDDAARRGWIRSPRVPCRQGRPSRVVVRDGAFA